MNHRTHAIARRLMDVSDADLAHLYTSAKQRLIKNLCVIEAGRRLDGFARLHVKTHSALPPITPEYMQELHREFAKAEFSTKSAYRTSRRLAVQASRDQASSTNARDTEGGRSGVQAQ